MLISIKKTAESLNLPIALPTMKALELGAAPQMADFDTVSTCIFFGVDKHTPTSKIMIAPSSTFLAE